MQSLICSVSTVDLFYFFIIIYIDILYLSKIDLQES